MPLTALLLLLAAAVQAAPSGDLVTDLPGLTFTPNFKHYSGYLDASAGNHLHYWFTESQSNPSKDPVILWLNGGPGCSSIGGLMGELGPFHPGKDGATIVENVQAWNKEANVLFIESPRDVGFSYRDASAPNDTLYNDDKTASDNALAIADFFKKFSEYSSNKFYVSGESYGGVYVPTLTSVLIGMIQNKTLTLNLAGMAVGNGILSLKDQINSAVDIGYYRGFTGKVAYDNLRSCCADENGMPLADCDFTRYLTFDPNGGNPVMKNFTDHVNATCAKNIYNLGLNIVWNTDNDVYNTYQDCYNFSTPTSANNGMQFQIRNSAMQRAFRGLVSKDYQMFTDGSNPFVDQGAKLNTDSTDAMSGFPCWGSDAKQTYLQRADVRKALHIPDNVTNWTDCNDDMNANYQWQHFDMAPVFQNIVNSKYPLAILIYNGDADLACNFLGDEWFIERFTDNNKMSTSMKRFEWFYQRGPQFINTPAGFHKQFKGDTVTIDLLTVKGAGHFVPMDRPGPALQMITNFLRATNNYTMPTGLSYAPQPLLAQYAPAPEKLFTRKQADRVWALPGLTYNLNFRQYSGYLHGVTGNYLHYWLVESQSNPLTDPLVLWLNGGPGCSSLGGFLTELGPFHPNRDNSTLYENIYSWNKGANVLFLEGPRNVGFSYQNQTENPDQGYDDLKTATDNFLALKDFLTVYPEYINRPFYVTGESYGGVYVPTLTSLLIDKIQAGDIPGLNLVGMAVGNGELSALQQINSAPHLLYFHGMYGKTEWDQLQKCCPTSTGASWFENCDFSAHITLDSAGNASPRNASDPCGQLVADMGQGRVWNSINDVYNMYQDCYQQTSTVFGSRVLSAHKEKIRAHLEMKGAESRRTKRDAGFVDQGAFVSSYSTDSQGGFPCFASSAAENWLNSADVKTALHINPLAPHWTDCNDTINAIYTQQHNDTGAVFDHIVKSGYPLRMLIYNGDVDMACNFLGDQWFVEALAKRQGMSASKSRDAWRFRSQIAGYTQQFSYGNGTIDLLTVKGAGHLVPTDRPGPALQMINNFIRGLDFSNNLPYDWHQTPLNKQYAVAAEIAAMNGSPTKAETEKTRGVSRRQLMKRPRKQQPEQADRAKRAATAAAPPPPPAGSKMADRVTNLPGLTYTPNFAMYSGYLPATAGNNLHYWYVESQSDPSKDPVILWLNGGPGCSSVGGFLEELGPFHVNRDGKTLYENVYSWNKRANVLFLEAPRGVGYSYQDNTTPPDNLWNDDKTAADNVLAIAAFFQRFPDLQNRDFYITGESYGGIYIPTLTDALIKAIQKKTVTGVKLVGVAIGNGELSQIQQVNSAVSLLYFRGMHGKEDWDSMSQCCSGAQNGSNPQTYCNWVDYITLDAQGNANPKYTDGSLAAQCGNKVVQQGFLDVWETDNDVYNTFQDCYATPPTGANLRIKRSADPRALHDTSPFVNQASKITYDSTDSNGGYFCYQDSAVTNYMNLPEVKNALHIVPGLPTWADCNDDINGNYVQQHNDTTPIFNSIIASNYPLRMLIYNGDVDMACQFLGDEWFIESLAAGQGWPATQRGQWNYTQTGFMPRIGGYWKRFNAGKPFQLDLLTVKGAGHFVPLDRPGPALQMIYNFVANVDYSSNATAVDITRSPLLAQYNVTVPSVPRRKADMVFSLPGLTFQPQFHQHSGYLRASPGNFLHYWFVESQNSGSDPVVLWLNGGPGCSSVGGLLTELGPFHPNPDGQTLFENVYSWNRYANVLFLEAPRGVGFSYQDSSVNNDTVWNDDKTASDTALALADFFNEYPFLRKNDFYITGESYGGVYVPTLTNLVIKQIQAGTLNVNLKGMAVGNGMLSTIQDINSLPDFMYFHGRYDKTTWESLKKSCCPADNNSFLQCDYSQFVNVDQAGNVIAKDKNDLCGQLVQALAFDRVWNTQNDVYNMYQSCYASTDRSFGSMSEKREERSVDLSAFASGTRVNYQAAYAAQLSALDPQDTTQTGGLQCYMTNAIQNYLNQTHVRQALNIPTFVQPWQFCSDQVGKAYQLQHNDTSAVFQQMLDSNYPLRVLIYNGDADTACSMFEAEWFIEKFAASNDLQMATKAKRTQWRYGQQIAGYVKQFGGKNMSIDLLTVKGAGHFVPTDRPGPAFQMINNFLTANHYNRSWPQIARQPLFKQYQQTGDGPTPNIISTTQAPTTTKGATGISVFSVIAITSLIKMLF